MKIIKAEREIEYGCINCCEDTIIDIGLLIPLSYEFPDNKFTLIEKVIPKFALYGYSCVWSSEDIFNFSYKFGKLILINELQNVLESQDIDINYYIGIIYDYNNSFNRFNT